MNTNVFDSSFFGYTNLPDSIELENRKLIPVKALKLKYEDHSMVSSCNFFSVSSIRSICSFVGIELYRPVKGLYCVEESYVQFFDYLHQLLCDGLISQYFYRDDIKNIYHRFSFVK